MKNHRLPGNARLLPLIAALGLMVGAGAAHSAPALSSITLKSGSSTYSCALSEFSISAGGLVSATATGCSPALGSTTPPETGGGTGEGGTGDGGTGDGGTGNGGTGNGGTGGADPGAGSWSPEGKPHVVVVDQSGKVGDLATILPGCVNGGSIAYDAPCSRVGEYGANINGTRVPVRFSKGQVLSVRYPVAPSVSGSNTGTLRLQNSAGGGLGIDTLISLSPTPGDMTGNGQTRCISRSNQNPSITTGAATRACTIDRTKSMYYLNIAPQGVCTGSSCVVWVAEGSFEFIR